MFSKTRIFIFILIPIVLAACAISFIAIKPAKTLSKEELATFEENLIKSRKREIKNYMELALNSIAQIQNDTHLTATMKEYRIRKLINHLSYGQNGYFFLYNQLGDNLAHPTLPNLVGKNSYIKQDKYGVYVVRSLIDAAKHGGGFLRYHWHHPSTNTEKEKLSYAVMLPKLGWIVGTGVYIEDINEEIAKVKEEITQNIRDTFFMVISILGLTLWVIIVMSSWLNIYESRRAHQRLRRKTTQFIRFQANERRRFSRELHDGVNQLLVATKYRINIALSKSSNLNYLENELDKAKETLDEAIYEIRHLSHQLRPRLLDDMGLTSAIKNLSQDFAEYSNIEVKTSLDLHNEQLPEHLEIIIYRIIQEAFNNIDKHAQATQVGLKLGLQNKTVYLEIKDNGRGFVLKQIKSDTIGIGIHHIQERADLVGGQATIESVPKQGTSIYVLLPLSP